MSPKARKFFLRAAVVIGTALSLQGIAGTAAAQGWGYQSAPYQRPVVMGPGSYQYPGGYRNPGWSGYQNPGWGGYPRPVMGPGAGQFPGGYQAQIAPAILPYPAQPRPYIAPSYATPYTQPAQQPNAGQPAQWTGGLQWGQIQQGLTTLGKICAIVCD